MTDIIQTRLNGNPYSTVSCAWNIALAPYIGVTALDYSEKRDRKLVYASRKDGTPLGMTGGQYMVDACSMTMLRSSAQILFGQLSVLGLGSYGDAVFPILAKYSEAAASLEGVPPIVVDIQGCRITGVKDSYAAGIDEQLTEITIAAMSVTRNGLRLWSVVNGIGQ